MQDDLKRLIHSAIKRCLPELEEASSTCTRPCTIWRKKDANSWIGNDEQRPQTRLIYRQCSQAIEEATDQFYDALYSSYPKLAQPLRTRFSTIHMRTQRQWILHDLLERLWDINRHFRSTDDVIASVINEMESFLEGNVCKVVVQVQLVNFSSDEDSIELPHGLRIRRMNEEEVSAYHGGDYYSIAGYSSKIGIHEFCLECEEEVSYHFDAAPIEVREGTRSIEELMDDLVVCLRTFKSGPVAFDVVRYLPQGFCPLILPSHVKTDRHMLHGTFHLSSQEIPAFSVIAEQMLSNSDQTLMVACSRLADAESRTQPRDKIIDAVIGLESLLLTLNHERISELGFRFALNYAMLQDKDNRLAAYRLARDLYALRSKLAHGAAVSKASVRLGEEDVSLQEAATRATTCLRQVVQFVLEDGTTSYKTAEFWQRRYFGLAE